MVMARKQTLVQLNEELLALLDERAARTDRSRSSLIREAIEQYLQSDPDTAHGRAVADGYQKPDATVDLAGESIRNALRVGY